MGKPILVPSCVAKPPLCFSMAYVLKGREKDTLGNLVKGYTLNISQGLLKIHLPSSAFLACANGKKRAKSLFEIKDSQQVTLKEMQRYMDLIVEFYRLSPEGSFSVHVSSRARFFFFCACGLAHMQGEFTIHFLCSVFELMDEDADHLLSHRQTRRDQKLWCLDEPSLYVCMHNFAFIPHAVLLSGSLQFIWALILCKKVLAESLTATDKDKGTTSVCLCVSVRTKDPQHCVQEAQRFNEIMRRNPRKARASKKSSKADPSPRADADDNDVKITNICIPI